MMRLTIGVITVSAMAILLVGCDSKPAVGSDKWCEAMGKKPKTEWTLEETGDYTKHCVLGVGTVEGSKEWCKDMEAKPKGDWTANEAGVYAKHCVF